MTNSNKNEEQKEELTTKKSVNTKTTTTAKRKTTKKTTKTKVMTDKENVTLKAETKVSAKEEQIVNTKPSTDVSMDDFLDNLLMEEEGSKVGTIKNDSKNIDSIKIDSKKEETKVTKTKTKKDVSKYIIRSKPKNEYDYDSLPTEVRTKEKLEVNDEDSNLKVDNLHNVGLQDVAILKKFIDILRCTSISKLSQVYKDLRKDTLDNKEITRDEVIYLVINDTDYLKRLLVKIKVTLGSKVAKLFTIKRMGRDIATLINSGTVSFFETLGNIVFRDSKGLESFKGKILFELDDDKEAAVYYFNRKIINLSVVDELGEKYSVSENSQFLINGDEVSGLLDRKNKIFYLQKIVSLHNTILGRIFMQKGKYILKPDDKVLDELHSYEIIYDETNRPKLGQLVIAKITKRSFDSKFEVEISEVLGDFEKLDVQIKLAITKHGIPHEWNQKVLAQVNKISDEVLEEDKANRVDLRKLPLVTIDGEDARDFDDAVYCKKEGQNYRLYVAIADVSYYVKRTSPLDKEAITRGNSVYFPNFVVPMLPEKLSNGLCSLNPHVDRLCMVCEVVVKKSGLLGDYKFYPAVMNSHARLTYTEVAKVFNGEEITNDEIIPLKDDLNNLHDLYKVLKTAREKRGGIEFESKEVRFIFDDTLDITDVVDVVRNDAHMMIEECMIAANVCAAEYVQKSQGETLYRVHARPSEIKVNAFRSFLQPLGFELGGANEPTSKDYADIAKKVKDNPNAEAIYLMMLHSMSLAQYDSNNEGHFGLALKNYAHFTSPIRRYPDLQLHREIKYLLGKNGEIPKEAVKKLNGYGYKSQELDFIADMANNGERRANMATREVDAVLKAKFISKFIGQSFDGIITNITHFGVFVSIIKYSIDGFIYIGNLGNDYFNYDSNHNVLFGENTRKVFHLGDKVKVIVSNVNTDDGKIDFLIDNKKNKQSINAEDLSEETQEKPQAATNNDVNAKIRAKMQKWAEVEKTNEKGKCILKEEKANNDEKAKEDKKVNKGEKVKTGKSKKKK